VDGVVQAAGRDESPAGTSPDGWQRSSGGGRADGGDFGPAGGVERAGPVRFDVAVPKDGYAWWYVDGLSDDGRSALTLIAFVGSVFSPYYAYARRNGRGDPENHCAFNVALYGDTPNRWTLTERGRASLARDATSLRIGPSSLAWDGKALTARIDEIGMPIPRRVRGTLTIRPEIEPRRVFLLDRPGNHRWIPFAPRARIEVDLEEPALHWRGSAYLDGNAGDVPLERSFVDWTWSRADLAAGTAVLYDINRRDGTAHSIAARFAPDGSVAPFAPPPAARLPTTGWRIARRTRTSGHAGIVRTLEDTPFYARSLVESDILGERVRSMHESLSLDRFDSRWVQALLPFRMPRARR
jgi:carotenoid 1,2-hydratase